MSYSSHGAKPKEYASKASHHHLINDTSIKNLLNNLHVPPNDELRAIASSAIKFNPVETTITDVFAIDGGFTESPINNGFPSAKMHFFQFGAVHFSLEDLRKIEISRHPDPDDMSKLKNIDRLKLALPTLNAVRKDCDNLKDSIRLTLHEFLGREKLGEKTTLLDTLSWFLFHKYKGADRIHEESSYFLSSNPYDVKIEGLELKESEMKQDYSFICPVTGRPIYLIDAFRLHENIDEQIGAAGICGYAVGVVEHLILLHLIRNLINFNGGLERSLLIMDRPTGFFGNTSRLVKPMQDLLNWLFDIKGIYLAGLEKSGAFVEHARQIKNVMQNSSYIILGNDHIYKYVLPASTNTTRPYADTSYYGHKVIFKTHSGQMYVVSMPVRILKQEPQPADIPKLNEILTHIEQLKCDMYENALLPIALANRLVSLAAVPSSKILESFAKSAIRG